MAAKQLLEKTYIERNIWIEESEVVRNSIKWFSKGFFYYMQFLPPAKYYEKSARERQILSDLSVRDEQTDKCVQF